MIEKPLRIVISVIPHQKQRYNTIGDWQITDDGTVFIRVSKFPFKFGRTNHTAISPRRQEFLVAIHEMIEAFFCQEFGVTTEEVDAFDKKWGETPRMQDQSEEPGDHPDSPYRAFHSLATGVERQLAFALGVPWYEYEYNINRLDESYPKGEIK